MPKHPHPLVRTHTIGAYRVVPDGPLPDGRDVGPDGQPGWRQDWFVEADIRVGSSTHLFTASLVLAVNEGTFSHPWERQIPARQLRMLTTLADRLADAGLF